MASVAVCPYCDSQLAVPSGTASNARVECPACRQQFELSQVEWRSIPEVLPVARPASTTTVADARVAEAQGDTTERAADADIAAWFGANKTVADFGSAAPADGGVEAKTQVADPPGRAADIAEYPADQPKKTSAATLADLLPPRTEAREELPLGPSFDLPNVPLVRENAATIEFDSSVPIGNGANTEFELDDVDFEATPAHTVALNEPFADKPDFARTAAADVPQLVERTPTARKPRRRTLRRLVGLALAGPVGLAAGYYVLLYLLGPTGDFLHVAEFLPQPLLPASFAPAAPNAIVAQPSAEAPSANIPASHAEPIKTPIAETEPAAEPQPREPAEFQEAPAVPLPAESPAATRVPRAIAGPEYTADQLFAAVRAAEEALPGLVTGDLSDQAVRRTKGQSYEKFCDLAHAITFCDATDDMTARLVDEAEGLIRDTLGDAHTRDEVARIAEIWIDYPNRRHGGVLLVGKLRGGQIAGDVYEYQLKLPTGGPLVILSPQPIDAALDAETSLAIVGTVVPQPADEVAGYSGTAERAIWVGRATPLP